jgi:hypothetical protein
VSWAGKDTRRRSGHHIHTAQWRRLAEALKREGYSDESAFRIATWRLGERSFYKKHRRKTMKCRYCGAKGVKITHFMQKHKALMLRKMRRGRGKGHGKGSHHSGGSGGHVMSTGGHSKARITFFD